MLVSSLPTSFCGFSLYNTRSPFLVCVCGLPSILCGVINTMLVELTARCLLHRYICSFGGGCYGSGWEPDERPTGGPGEGEHAGTGLETAAAVAGDSCVGVDVGAARLGGLFLFLLAERHNTTKMNRFSLVDVKMQQCLSSGWILVPTVRVVI